MQNQSDYGDLHRNKGGHQGQSGLGPVFQGRIDKAVGEQLQQSFIDLFDARYNSTDFQHHQLKPIQNLSPKAPSWYGIFLRYQKGITL